MEVEFTPLPWQQVIVDQVNQHEDLAGSERFQSMSDYERSRATRIQIALPVGSGHSTLSAYLAHCFESVVVYFDIDHYRELSMFYQDISNSELPWQPQAEGLGQTINFVSVFQIYHDIMSATRVTGVTADNLNRTKSKFAPTSTGRNRVVIIDRANKVAETHPEIIDWIFQISNGPVVMLG
jgi:pantothenate kinase